MVRGRGSATPDEIKARKIISENINRLLKEQGKRKVDLHKETQIPKSSITGYVQGTSLPKEENLQKIAEFFGVKEGEIDPRQSMSLFSEQAKHIIAMFEKLDETDKQKVIDYVSNLLEQKETKIIAFPTNNANSHKERLSGKLSAGTGYYNIEEWDNEVQVTENAPRHDYVFQVEGNSMEPVFTNGQLIFGKKENQLENGGIYALEVNFEDAYVKKVYLEEDCVRLVSLNEEYKDIIVNPEDNIKIVARILN